MTNMVDDWFAGREIATAITRVQICAVRAGPYEARWFMRASNIQAGNYWQQCGKRSGLPKVFVSDRTFGR
ncbi:hypothetical protein EN813_047465 [Mesorhizobium sp. M00.F.Ca.ET.170.01.1.1]|nr:hypothetical protein EN813_047465 [Mesorhizobium sp. M00.F.Ca.ET.170.01.1.1]